MFRQKSQQYVNAFTPESRFLQMKYALESSRQGAMSIGICTPQGVVLAAEKRYASPLIVATTLDKIVKVDTHIACTLVGLSADARSLIVPARTICANHWFTYNQFMPIESMVECISQLATQLGLGFDDSDTSSSDTAADSSDSNSDSNTDSDQRQRRKLLPTSRFYGVDFLFAGICDGEPQLWHLEPSGEFGQVGIKVIGSGSDAAGEKLQESYRVGMHLNEAMTLALTTLEEAVGQKLTSSNLDLMVVTRGPLCHMYTKPELEVEIARSLSSTEDEG